MICTEIKTQTELNVINKDLNALMNEKRINKD